MSGFEGWGSLLVFFMIFLLLSFPETGCEGSGTMFGVFFANSLISVVMCPSKLTLRMD
jgi:hypothetical protein